MIGTFCSIKFYLNDRNKRSDTEVPIYMRIIIRRKKAELFLTQFADPKFWDEKKERLKTQKKSDAYINHHLNDIETKINQIIWDLEEEKEIVSAKAVMQRLTGKSVKTKHTVLKFIDTYINEVKAKKEISGPVIAQYQTMRGHFENYLKSAGKEDIFLTQIRRSDLDSFEHYLLTHVPEKKEQAMNRNTANKYLIRLKTVMINARRKQLIIINPFDGFKIKTQRSEKIFLTKEEIELIRNHDMAGNESLVRVKDFFLFSIFTGLRFSDASTLKSENIRKGEGGRLWIISHQKKTGEPIEVPMLNQAKEIYDKYEVHRLATGYVLPRLCNQKVNTYLREIMKLVGIKKDVSSHCARHTFATTVLLENGIDLKTVSRFMGHHSVKSTEVYAKITKDLLENVASKIDNIL